MLNALGLGYDAVDAYDRDWGAREGLVLNQGVVPNTRNYPIAAKRSQERLGWNVPEGHSAPYKPDVVHVAEGLSPSTRQDVLNHELRHSSLDRRGLPKRTEEYVNRRMDQEYMNTPSLKRTEHVVQPTQGQPGMLPAAEIEYQKYRDALGERRQAVQGQYIPGTAPTDVIKHEMRQQNLRAVAPEGWNVQQGPRYHPAISEVPRAQTPRPVPSPTPQAQRPVPSPSPSPSPTPTPKPQQDTLGFAEAEADATRKQYSNPAASRDQMVQSGQLYKQGNTYSTKPFK
jgi:hypothetical protein